MTNTRLFRWNIQTLFFFFYILLAISLFLYSFTQVDLSLTLSRASFVQNLQKFFQGVGFFNRPLSTAIYIGIILLLFAGYLLILSLVKRNKLQKRLIWVLILAIVAVLTFSYNAFSYDLFNYIFDAKIVSFYNQNPYVHKALDFPGDPMLSFMRWTHRTFPYGPTWLGLTIPLSYLGLQYFVVTLVLFKSLMALAFLGTAYFIGRILRVIRPEYELLGTVFFAFNPLIIIESIVSAHNDIVMMFLAVIACYFLITKNLGKSFLFLAASIGIKFATFFLLPIFAAGVVLQQKGKTIEWEKFFLASVILMVLGVVAASIRSDFQLQPWYLMFVLPFSALLAWKKYIAIPSIIMSFFTLFIYVPFIYLGNYDPPVPSILASVTIAGVIVSLFGIGVGFLLRGK